MNLIIILSDIELSIKLYNTGNISWDIIDAKSSSKWSRKTNRRAAQRVNKALKTRAERQAFKDQELG